MSNLYCLFILCFYCNLTTSRFILNRLIRIILKFINVLRPKPINLHYGKENIARIGNDVRRM